MDTLANYSNGGCEGPPRNPIIEVAASSHRIDCVLGKFDPVLLVVRYLFKETINSMRGGGSLAE